MAIAAGQFHNVGLRSNGTVFAWGGFNNNGELNVPAGLSSVRAIAAGGDHSLALRSNGTVVAWGDNATGETNVPAGLTNIAAIAAGDAHCLALRSNGTIVAWGDNASGQTNTPANLTNAARIAAGYHHNLAIRSNTTMVAWELNVYGETNIPPGLSNVIAVSGGHFLSVALRTNGSVLAWGDNSAGATNVPVGLTNVIAISAGSDHVMALTPSPVCTPGFPDNFECRQTITGSNFSFTASNVGATREPGEPQHYSVPSSNSIWFEWTAPFTGGLVFKSQFPDGSNLKPIVAIYTGTVVSNLTKLANNSTGANTSGGNPVARAVITASAGQTYEIAVDGFGEGILTNTLTLTPPPSNDMFAAATPINGTFYVVTNSFIGASRETGEPTHGDASLGQTLWWSWTSLSNGPTPLPVRIMADAVSFPPAVGVYTGNSVSTLTPVTLTIKTNGMTSDVTFNSIPGTTYRIALAGRENDTDSASSLIGTFHFRLNTRALGITITNLTASTNIDGSVPFQADARIQNSGLAATAPLRVSVNSLSGLSTTRDLSTPPVTTVSNLLVTNVTTSLPAGQTAMVHFAGTVPAPNPADASTPIAYGVYADLQEQPVTNVWFIVDETLVSYDQWPGIGSVFGPGGGVIRFEPGYTVSPFSPITAMAIFGPTTVTEGRTTNYTGQVIFAGGTVQNLTNASWSASQFAIASNGVFTTGSVTSNTVVTVTLSYYFSGITFITSTNVTVSNLPPPFISKPSLLGNAGFVFTLSGVPGRSNVIEATTNLAPAVWVPLITNAPTNGLFTFTNFSRTNFPRRFYRAREQ
jgi:hypothetical protein